MKERFILEVDRSELFDFLSNGVKTPDAGVDMLGRRIVESILAGEVSMSDAIVLQLGHIDLTREE